MNHITYKAAWLLPAFIEGSGGHRTIFQAVEYLLKHGYACDVYVEDNGQVKNIPELKKTAEKYFGRHRCSYYLGYRVKKQYDIIFATVWYTAKIVHDYKGRAKKAYFIQDYEASFYPVGEKYLMACDSYSYGLYPVTIGKWLSQKMMQEHHMPSQYFEFCADTGIYKKLRQTHKKDRRKEQAVCFIYQPEKSRRCSNIGIAALGIIKYLRPEIKIYLYGSDVKRKVWFAHENLGILSIEQCNELYNRCTAGLCISTSNPSRIPFEMMAAGLPAVDIYMENNLYDMPHQGISLAHYTPESIAQALLEILDDDSKREEMSRFGQAFMKTRTLDDGMEQFYRAVENIVHGTCPPAESITRRYKKKAVKADSVRHMLTKKEWKLLEQRSADGSLAGRLKRNPYIKNNKLVKKVYWKIRNF